MNLEQQMQPGPGSNGTLANVSIDDLIRELKSRCTAMAVVMVVEDDDGEDVTLTKTLGSSLILLGACAELTHTILNRNAD